MKLNRKCDENMINPVIQDIFQCMEIIENMLFLISPKGLSSVSIYPKIHDQFPTFSKDDVDYILMKMIHNGLLEQIIADSGTGYEWRYNRRKR